MIKTCLVVFLILVKIIFHLNYPQPISPYCFGPLKFCNIEQFDVIFHYNKSGLDLLIAIIVCACLITFLLIQANLLNLSFFPNSTFDSEKYSPYECGFLPFKTE